MRLTVDIEDEDQPRTLPGDGAALIAFMSFAVMRGFGATHPLIALADLLHDEQVPLGPLTTFYESAPEDSEDVEKLEMAWQGAAPVAESAARLTGVLATHERAAALVRRADADGLAVQAQALEVIAREAAGRGSRIRLGYEL